MQLKEIFKLSIFISIFEPQISKIHKHIELFDKLGMLIKKHVLYMQSVFEIV